MTREFYCIDNLTATKFTPRDPAFPKLENQGQYLIDQQSHNDNGGNWHFSYTVKNKIGEDTAIELNSWKIISIYSVSAFSPNDIHFEIQDPKGITNRDLKIKIDTKKYGTCYFIAFPGQFVKPLNQGLELFKRLSTFKNWYDFLISPSNEGYSIDAMDRFTKYEKENDTLKAENTLLKERLKRIQEAFI